VLTSSRSPPVARRLVPRMQPSARRSRVRCANARKAAMLRSSCSVPLDSVVPTHYTSGQRSEARNIEGVGHASTRNHHRRRAFVGAVVRSRPAHAACATCSVFAPSARPNPRAPLAVYRAGRVRGAAMTTAVQGDFFGPRCALAVLADLFLGYALWAEIRGSEASRYFAETA